jgi:hypothetical protein
MAKCFRFILVVSALFLSSCDRSPGGGGSANVPPDSIAYGQPMPLRLELSVWGAGSGKVSERYSDIRCHYKTEKASEFTPLQGRFESEATDRMFVVFELPPFSAADGAHVEYYFDMKLDGHYNKRDVARVPLY